MNKLLKKLTKCRHINTRRFPVGSMTVSVCKDCGAIQDLRGYPCYYSWELPKIVRKASE